MGQTIFIPREADAMETRGPCAWGFFAGCRPQDPFAATDRGTECAGRARIIVVCGGVVPRQDYEFLLDQGVAAVFGPGTNVLEAGRAVLNLMEGKRRNQ
ncbi:hypothetical protein [Pontitalea aquivivens]|uniref:hypothetical protein n=1 Tax=Pontitalea aquivivens TaxID=3388663 RepID=UPI00397104EE